MLETQRQTCFRSGQLKLVSVPPVWMEVWEMSKKLRLQLALIFQVLSNSPLQHVTHISP